MGIVTYARKISIPVSTTSQTQMEINNLLLPAKCSSACACAFISLSLRGSVPARGGQNVVHVNRHDVDQRENKHPDEVNEVPVQAANLHVFVFQLLYATRDDEEVNQAGRDVKHVQASDREERRAK